MHRTSYTLAWTVGAGVLALAIMLVLMMAY